MWNFFKRLFISNNETHKIEEIIIEDDPMKYLIAGLGNVGSKYAGTRHNIGFEVLDELAEKFDATFKNDTQADIATIKHKGRTLILIKPTTYMNLSGKAVRYWMTKHKVKPENLLVIVDDLNLDFHTLRLRAKGKDGGHNGLKNINDLLQTQQYARLKLGIGDNFNQGKQVNFVLGKWSEKEAAELGSFLARATKATLDFATIGIARAMSGNNG